MTFRETRLVECYNLLIGLRTDGKFSPPGFWNVTSFLHLTRKRDILKTTRIATALTILLLAVLTAGCGSPATLPTATQVPSDTPLPTDTTTPLPTITPTPITFDIAQAGQIIINDGFPLLTTSVKRPETCPGTTCSVYRADNNYITVLENGMIVYQQKNFGGEAFVFSKVFNDLYGQEVADLVNQNLPTSLGMSYTFTLNGFLVSIMVGNSDLAANVIPNCTVDCYHATQTAWAPKP